MSCSSLRTPEFFPLGERRGALGLGLRVSRTEVLHPDDVGRPGLDEPLVLLGVRLLRTRLPRVGLLLAVARHGTSAADEGSWVRGLRGCELPCRRAALR